MSFRQFGGLQFATKHNAVASQYNTSNNLLVTQNVGQSDSYINFLSDISGNTSSVTVPKGTRWGQALNWNSLTNSWQITGNNNLAFGNNAGYSNQQANAIAIGYNAGNYVQGSNSVAIGCLAGEINQFDNSIILNATGTTLNGENSGFFIKPITISPLANFVGVLFWDSTSGEIQASSAAKTFVIDHPINENKYLVHACLEGPESGVYYRGKGEIVNNESVIIHLPHYVEALATDFTIQITPIYNGKINTLNSSEVTNNTFTVHGDNCKFYWNVTGKRFDIDIEPLKSSVDVKGDGPYLYI